MKNILAVALLLIFSTILCSKVFSQPLGENSSTLYPPGSSKALSPEKIITEIPPQYQKYFLTYSRETGIPPELMFRLARWESGFDPRKTNLNPETRYHGASVDVGLFMLNSDNLGEFSLKYNGGKAIDPTDPETSIRVAFRYMQVLRKKWGSDSMALIAWNGGMLFLKKSLPLPDGTRRLLKEVLG